MGDLRAEFVLLTASGKPIADASAIRWRGLRGRELREELVLEARHTSERGVLDSASLGAVTPSSTEVFSTSFFPRVVMMDAHDGGLLSELSLTRL